MEVNTRMKKEVFNATLKIRDAGKFKLKNPKELIDLAKELKLKYK